MQFKALIREIHRRSLWQVLGIYIVGSWVVLQVVDVLADNMELPPWTFPFAVVLLLIGLPIVLATAFVQEGLGTRKYEVEVETSVTASAHDGGDRDARHRLFTWRNAVIGGVVAFALWGVAAAGWLLAGRPGLAGADNVDKQLHSIAVLPFSSVQTDEESQAFVSGIHDDLLTQLSKIDSLTVISRTSVMKYRGASKGIPEIAQELGVATVLEGGVQRSGGRVRVNVQLIEAATDKHLWAETYDEQLTAATVFDIQSDLARKIATALRARLSPETRARIQERPTESLEAYDLVTRGRYIMNSRGATREGIEAARELFDAAIAADSTYAPAHLGRGIALSQLWNLGYLEEAKALPASWQAVERALALDPNLAEAHAARGGLLRAEGKYEESRRALQRALELNPGSAAVRNSYSALLLDLGRPEEALSEARRAVELDPLAAGARRALLSRLVFARRYDEALVESRSLLEIQPDEADAYYYAAFAHSLLGQHAQAIAGYRKSMAMNPADPYYPAGLAWAYARAGKRVEALATVKQAEALNAPIKEIAIVFGALGDLDRAFELLDRAYETERTSLYNLSADPSCDPLRADPRWKDLRRRLGVN